MSLPLREKSAISSIFPLQKGGSRTPSNSKYLLSNSMGVLGVSASLSAIVAHHQPTDTPPKKKKKKKEHLFFRSRLAIIPDGSDVETGRGCVLIPSPPSTPPARPAMMLQGEGRVVLEPIRRARGDVMHECQHQDQTSASKEPRMPASVRKVKV